MRRERVEAHLDKIFAQQLNEPTFLERIASELVERTESKTKKGEISKLHRMQKQLDEKRERVLNAYFEKLISRTELDRRLTQMKADQRFCEQQIANLQLHGSDFSAVELAEILAPLNEWIFLSRADKRRLLHTIVPEIHLQNYRVTKLAVLVQEPHRDEMNHTDRDSWPRQA